MTTYRRTAARDALGALHRYGTGLGIVAAVVATVSEIVAELQKQAPPEWAHGLVIAGIVLAACGRALPAVRHAVDADPVPALAPMPRARAPRARAADGRFVPGETPRAARQPRRAAPSRNPELIDPPIRSRVVEPAAQGARPLVRDTTGDSVSLDLEQIRAKVAEIEARVEARRTGVREVE